MESFRDFSGTVETMPHVLHGVFQSLSQPVALLGDGGELAFKFSHVVRIAVFDEWGKTIFSYSGF